MIRCLENHLLRKRSGVFVISCVLLVPLSVGQQKKIDPQSFQYKKDYARFSEIKQETDPQKRSEMLLAFIKDRPDSGMIPYVIGEYTQILATHQKAGAWPRVIEMNEALLALLPEEEVALRSLMAAYYQTKNLAKTAEIGEKLYKRKPDKAMATDLAALYLQLKNNEKYLVYAQKILAEFPMEQAYGTALQVAQIYLQKKEIGKATDLLAEVMQTYGDKVPDGVQESAWNKSRAFAFGMMAARSYQKKDYPKAIEQYSRVATYAPGADEPYYYIGMSKWQDQELEDAMAAFAKAVVLNKAFSQKARQHLEHLYKPLHNDSLDGLDQVLATAKADLRIGG